MAFWTAIVRFIAVEKLRGMGEEVLAHGRAVFAAELATGKTQKEAARIAAKAMTRHAADKSRGIGAACGGAARLVRDKAGTLAGTMAGAMANSVAGALSKPWAEALTRAVREKMRKK